MKKLVIIFTASAMLATVGLQAQASPTGQAPNILFISIDDFRPELGTYGSPQVITPHIDQLVATGLRFDRAYCQVPVCGASRASMLTGILPTPSRFTNYNTRAQEDVPGASTLPETFKRAGYTTISNGKIFHHKDDTAARSWSEPAWRPAIDHMHSFDPETTRRLSQRERGRIYEAPDVADDAYMDGLTAIKTIEDLRRLKADGKPFFLACGFIRPHLPFYAPKKYWDLYQSDAIEIAENRYRPENAPSALRGSGEYKSYHLADYDVNSEAFHRMMRHGYLAATSYVDQLTGDVLTELERLGLAEKTIVVIWGDHGWHLGEHNFWGKHNTTQLAMRVPLIIKVPGKASGSTRALVENVDLYPTLCELAGIDVPTSVQGRSFAALLDRPGQSFHKAAYSRYGSGDAVVTERYSYTSYHNGKSEMLYDLQQDPAENRNVAGEPGYKPVVEKLRRLLEQKKTLAAAAEIGQPGATDATAENTANTTKQPESPDESRAGCGAASQSSDAR